jgi:glutaconyl-CoA/methylmalonyl-CoA decarboxylase subunit gamma
MKKMKLTLNDKEYKVEILSVTPDKARVKVNEVEYVVGLEMESTSVTPSKAIPKTPSSISTPSAQPAQSTVQAAPGTILAPMPGLILEVHCNIGDTVEVGQLLFTMEAMKMENKIKSNKAGTVKKISAKKGEQVKNAQLLMEIE